MTLPLYNKKDKTTKLMHCDYHYFLYGFIGVTIGYIVLLQLITVPYGHDLLFHANRIQSLTQEMRAGNFPARIYHSAMNGMGYASPLFYGDLLLYIPATLHLFGVSLESSYKIFMSLCAVLMTLSMYYAATHIFKSEKKAGYAAFFYSLSSYAVIDLLDRQALGEFQSFIFLPLVSLGIYSILNGDKKKWLFLPLGLCGVLFTHMITAVLCVVVLGIYFLCHLKTVHKDKQVWELLCWSVIIFFLLSAGFIFPMLEQLWADKFHVTAGVYIVNLAERSVPLLKGFVQQGARLWFPLAAALSYLALLVLFSVLYYRNKRNGKRNKQIGVLLVFSWATYILTTDLFPWNLNFLQETLHFIQFPWRFFSFTMLFLAFIGGYMADSFVYEAGKKKFFLSSKRLIQFAMCITVVAYSSTIIYKAQDPSPWGLDDVSSANIGAGCEYLPAGSDYYKLVELSESEHQVYTNKKAAYTYSKEHGKVTVNFTQNGSDLYFDLPLIYYKGYTANINIGGNQIQTTEVLKSDTGLVQVYVGDTAQGEITVWYGGTFVQKLSLYVSLVTAVCLLFWRLKFFPHHLKR